MRPQTELYLQAMREFLIFCHLHVIFRVESYCGYSYVIRTPLSMAVPFDVLID
jgi:hypothetical protein